MVVQTGRGTSLEEKNFQINDGDPKPVLTENNTGSTCYDVDNKQGYTWHVDAWYAL